MVDELLEIAVDPNAMPKRYRKGCWWLFGIFWTVIIGGFIILSLDL